MKKLPFEVVLSLIGIFFVLGALLIEQVIREHLTMTFVLLNYFLPTLIAGTIINLPVWYLFGRKQKKKDEA